MQQVIENIRSGNITLSYSGIREFAKSPAHFVAYKAGTKVTTPSMKKGSLIHCAILEPDTLASKYAVLLREMLPNPDLDFRNSENQKYKKQFEASSAAEKKEMITPDEWAEALAYRDLAYSNEVCAPYLNRLESTESFAEWEFGGYKWRGVRDGIGDTFILDLKTVNEVSPDKIRYKVRDEKMHWQQFLYKQAPDVGGFYDSFNLLTDGAGIALCKLEWSLLQQAEAELTKLLDAFKMCQENNLWHMNFEFWADRERGYFSID